TVLAGAERAVSGALRVDAGARSRAPGLALAPALLGSAVLAALLAGWAPLGFSIVTVFLFAGPHNWLEARYFLGRLPARWGRLRGFFLLAFGGIFGLTAAFAVLPWCARGWEWDEQTWLTAEAAWNSLLLFWVAALVRLRTRQNPRRDWPWVTPAAL